MYRTELVEGKDAPAQRGPPEYDNLGKTAGLMIRMCRPIWGSDKTVVQDSGFGVVAGIVGMKKKGVRGQSLVKKRRYWPKGVPGDDIDALQAEPGNGTSEQ